MAMEATEPAVNPFDAAEVTEELPAWELWDEGVEPDSEEEPGEHTQASRGLSPWLRK